MRHEHSKWLAIDSTERQRERERALLHSRPAFQCWGGTSDGDGRMLFLFVRRCYSSSSKAWIQRQARDPYVKAAKSQHYRARSAFKLLQMDEKYRLIRPGHVVVDCGAAPGGWTQVAAAKARHVVAVDILPMEPVPNATVIQGDFTSPEVQAQVHEALQGSPVQLVCSDMAPRFTGNHMADHARSLVRQTCSYMHCLLFFLILLLGTL